MSDTSGLVSELLGKLADFDRKVQEYRHDLAGQFHDYSVHLLKDQPGHVSDEINDTVARLLHNYPALGIALGADGHFSAPSAAHPRLGAVATAADDASDDDDATARRARSSMSSPPPVLPHTSGTPPPLTSGLMSPDEREREHEFHGLFTPSYLPLLDATTERRPPPPPATIATVIASATSASPAQCPPTGQDVKPNKTQESSPPTPNAGRGAPTRPDPVRRLTGDTISSTTSDDGTHPRRSALRRSSSSSIKGQSPRRVRFDVEGQEVSTTTSPLLSPRITDLPAPTPLSNSSSLLSDDTSERTGHGEFGLGGSDGDDDDSTGLLGSSPPAPKKISSTDRLKAMARSSTENTADWMVVGNAQGSDSEDEDEGITIGMNGRRRPAAPQPTAAAQPISNRGISVAAPSGNASRMSAPETIPEHSDEDESDEDMLEMPALSSFKNRKRFSPTEPQSQDAAQGSSLNGQHKAAAERPNEYKPLNEGSPGPGSARRQENVENDHEDLFEFDGDDDDDNARSKKTTESRPPTKYLTEEPEEETEEPQDDAGPATTSNPSVYSASPGVPIARRAGDTPLSPQPRMQVGSVGSYRGRSLVIGSVVNEKIHEKAAQMGDFSSFIGSVDGRTGPDESGSYRPPISSLKGTPKSFSERMLKEELAEVDAGAGQSK